MTIKTKKVQVDDVAEALLRDTGTIDLEDDEARLFVHTIRRLAEGQPISPTEVARLASEVNLSPDQAGNVLNWVAEKNEAGDIVGLAGLSLNEWSHGFRTNGQDFTTWCALDTLYLPRLIKKPAEIVSRDPVTQEPIRFTLGPDGVENAPEGAVISIVIPQIAEQGIQSAEQIWNTFCSYSLYFASAETAEEWFAGKQIEPIFLSIEDGYEIGRQWFAQIIAYA